MLAHNYLLKNKKILNSWTNKQTYMCDFETLTKSNLIKTKNDTYISKVYLWGILAKNFDYCLWGTTIEDFLATLKLIVRRVYKKNNFTFYFHNLDWDHNFFKNQLFSIDKIVKDYEDFKKNRKQYLKGDRSFEGKYYIIKSGDRPISYSILMNDCVVDIKCSYRKSMLSVDGMSKFLNSYGIETPKKLKEEMDYDLVDKVYSRKELFEKVYQTKMNDNNFLKCDYGKGKYGVLIKYLYNDLKIPLTFMEYFEKQIDKLNISFTKYKDLKHKQPYQKWSSKKIFLIGSEWSDKEKEYIEISKIIIKEKGKISKVFEVEERKNYITTHKKIKLLDNLNKEIYVLDFELEKIHNYGATYEVLESKRFNKLKLIETLPKKFLTTSGFSWKGFKNYYGKNNFEKDFGSEKENILTYKDYFLITRSYAGGLTGFNKNNMGWEKENDKVISIDINSSYPYEMLKPLPYGRPKKNKENENDIGFFEVKIKSFKVKKKWEDKIMPLIPKWKTQFKNQLDSDYLKLPKYLYNYNEERGEFIACFDSEEWEELNKYYNFKYKIINKIWFSTKPFLKDFIEIVKDIKINAKSEGERNLGKLIMNSIYGKTAQKVVSEEDYYFKTNDLDITQLTILSFTQAYKNPVNGKMKNVLSTFKLYNLEEILKNPKMVFKKNYSFIKFLDKDRKYFYIKVNKNIDNEYFGVRQVGSIITSRARWHLINTMLKVGWKNVKYYDTDSIYMYDNKETKKALENVFIDNKILGAWCYEKKIDKMKVLGAKNYQLYYNYKWGKNDWIKLDNYEYEYKVAGLSKANAIFERVGHNKYFDKSIIKNVNVKKKVLDEGVILEEPIDFILEKKTY